MVNLGTTYSNTLPQSIEITKQKVYVASNIEVNQNDEISVPCYKFNLIEYDKDEYIILMADKAKEIDMIKNELEATKILLGVE